MRHLLLPLFLIFLGACQSDETLTGYGALNKDWHLVEARGLSQAPKARIHFPQPGKITGQAPCNSYFTTQNAPYPWFETGLLGVSKIACPALKAEQQYFALLGQARQAEVLGNILILSDDAGPLLTFKSVE